MRNDWVLSYTKPLMELQGHPDPRYKSICGRISTTGDESNKILATLRNGIERFRNDTVSIIQDGLLEVMGIGRSKGSA